MAPFFRPSKSIDMARIKIKRNSYRDHKYYYTALRFMVEIMISPMPPGTGKYNLYKTQRKYIIATEYNVYKKGKLAMKVPIKITMPITSKDRGDLCITMAHEYWRFRPMIVETLKNYYFSL